MAQPDDDFDWTTAVPVEDETSSTLAATPFGARTQPQPTQGPVVYDDEFDWKTAVLNEEFDASTARPLTPQEEHAYYKGLDEASRDPARILTNLEHSSLYDWRQEQDDAVSRFFEGASDIPGNLAQIAVDATKETAQNYAENYALNRGRFYKRNIATGMEAGRKIGVQLLQLFDWGQNKASDIVQRGRANDVKMREIAAQIPKTGDERVDGDNVMAAIAKARDEGVFDETPFGPNKEEDYERYLRQNSYNRTHAGTITEATMGGKTMTFPEEQLSFMGEKPMQSVATGGAMIFDPVNALPVGAGIFSKLRILRRLSRVTGMPLPAVERGLAGAADRMEDLGTRAAAKVTEKTGLSKNQQLATLGTTSAGAGLLAANTDGMDGVLLPVAALASVPVLYKLVGGTIRKTSQAAGVGAEVVREMRAGNIGSMRQASAEDLLRTGAVPKPYADFMQPYATGVESTLGRMAKNPNNAEITRKLSRLADNTGVTQAFRFTDDAVSSGVAATLASTPFALLAPDEEQAGAIVGGAAFLGTVAGPATGAFTRRQGAVNADIARMLIDVHAVNGDVPALLSLGRDRLGQIAGMQGIVAGKTDFVTLRASDYRANVDLRKSGNETKAGVFIEKASDGTARIFINVGEPVSMDGKVRVRDRGDGAREIRVRGEDGRTEFIAAPKSRRLLVNDGDTVKAGQQVVDYLPATRSIPHEIAHAILTSDILDGDIRTDMQNYVTQVYGEDGIQARGREYIGKIVDGDIMFGTHEGQVILTPEEAADVRSGKRTMSDVMKGKPVEAAERDALIAARIDEYNQRSRENGGNDWDWARNEVIAEQFAGESQGIDFRSIRRGGPKLMESALATSARVLEALGAKFDRSTGKPLDNPSVLFRDNPLFQSPVLRKRMIEHVRAYNDLLTGLEEAGKREARGTKVSVDGTPESAARSPHMKQRADQDQGGRVGNEFLYTDETGKTQWRSPSEVRGRENARTSQAKTLYNPSRIVSPTSTEFGLRRTDSGRTIISGPTLPAQFDHFVHFPKWFREFARTLEASRERGGTFIADYNAIGDGKDGTYRVRNRGDIRAILREVGFIGWEMTRNNHLKAVLIDLNAFRAATMKAINNGELGIFNNDMSVIEADLRAYLDNHKNGRPGETGIGQAKRDMLNGLIGTGTAVQRKANPLYSDLNPRGSVRSFRLDRFNDLTPTGREGLPFDYDKINQNRMPSALPQAGMAMPDAAPVRTLDTDRLLREYEENQGYLGLSTMGMREGRPVKGGAAETRRLLARNTEISQELDARGVKTEDAQLQRALARRQTGQAMPDVDVQWETYAENLRDDVESWSPARDTGKIDYDMQDVVDSFVDFARTNPKMTGSELTAAFYRAEKPTASQRKKLNAAIANVGEPPRVATGGTRGQAMPDISDAPPFFLKSSQALDAKIQGKAATPDQVKAILTNPQNGIKAEELKWTGVMQEVERLAKENNGKVPKDALLRYLAEDGAVRFEEVRMGGAKKQWTQADIDQLEREAQRTRDFSAYERAVLEYEDQQLGSDANNTGNQTRYGQYQLAGGENYREVVLAMPAKEALPFDQWLASQGIDSAALDAMPRYDREQLVRQHSNLKNQAFNESYRSTHFDTPNYVAHMRLNERVDAKGKPGLFIEELQSDRHQQGREKGYQGEGDLAARKDKVDQWNALMDEVGRREEAGERAHTHPELSALVRQADELGNTIPEADFDGIKDRGIPDAPFRTSWPLQLFKRALRDAVADGKEWIGWTTGETQAARYDLSKQLSSIEWYEDINHLMAYDKSGNKVIERSVTREQLPNVIGKEATQKLVESKLFNEGQRIVSGVDLKVGGEGMKGFYDTMVPKDVAKYVKQWGAQVEKVDVATRVTIDTPQALETVRYIRGQGGVAAASRSMEQAAKVNSLLAQLERRMSQDRISFADAWTEIPNSTAKNDLKSVLGFRGIKGIASLNEIKPVAVWRVNITPQMREGIKKAGQALFVGGVAAVVAEDQLEQ
jgi:hypothetical protein